MKTKEIMVENKNRVETTQKDLTSIDQKIVLSIFPNAEIVYISGNPHIFNDGVDLSTLHEMQEPSTLEQAWVQASKSAQYADNVELWNRYLEIFSDPLEGVITSIDENKYASDYSDFNASLVN